MSLVAAWARGQWYAEIVCRAGHKKRVIERLRLDDGGAVDLFFGDPVEIDDGGAVIGDHGQPVDPEDPDDTEWYRFEKERQSAGRTPRDRSTLEESDPYDPRSFRKYRFRCPSCRLDAQLSAKSLNRFTSGLMLTGVTEVELSHIAGSVSKQ